MQGARLIAGSGRSGTTWIQDALANANGLRPVFEPLHPWESEIGLQYAQRALDPEADHPELQQFLSDVCEGRRNAFWSRYRRHREWLLPPLAEMCQPQDAVRLYRRWGRFLRQVPQLSQADRKAEPLVKCIRANLMLGWLANRSDFRIALIVRHPGAVIESELRNRWNADYALERFRRDSTLRQLTDNRYRTLLERHLTPVEELAARWVIENQWPIEQASASGIPVFHYETLIASPLLEWRRLCRALDVSRVPAGPLRAKPSQQSSLDGPAAGRNVGVPIWRESLTSMQIALIQGVLNETGFELYSMNEPKPRYGHEPLSFAEKKEARSGS